MTELNDPMRAVLESVDAVIAESGADDPHVYSELAQVWQRNRRVMEHIRFRLGPMTAQFDAHMVGGDINGHTARADTVAALLTGITEASKEIAKDSLGTAHLGNDYLVHGILPGSVRLLIEAPQRKAKLSKKPGDVVPDGVREVHHHPSAESNALRKFAKVLSLAEPTLEASEFDALVRTIPPAARLPFKTVAETVKRGDFEISGEVREREVTPVELTFTPDRAEHLVKAIDRQPIAPTSVQMKGMLDGFRKSSRTVYLMPESGKPIAIRVADDETLEAVARLGSNPEQYVEVHFTARLLKGVPAGNRSDARVLNWIRPTAPPAPEGQQPPLDLEG